MPVSWVWYKSSTDLACSYYVNFSNFTNTSGASWQTTTLVWQMNDNVFHFCSESSCHLRRFSLAISFGSLLSCVRFGDAHRKMLGCCSTNLIYPHFTYSAYCCLISGLQMWISSCIAPHFRVFRGNFSTPLETWRESFPSYFHPFPTIDFRCWGKTPWSRGFPDSGSSRFSWLSAPGTWHRHLIGILFGHLVFHVLERRYD